MSDRWQYLILLGLCLLITAPLELFGDGVYRRLHRTVRAVLPVAVVFLVWDAVAIAAGVWTYDGKYISGFDVPPNIPIEEVLFFLVIPLCGLLTYNAVSTIVNWGKRK
ncbi:lycopene cyclase domain-containing protein [Mycobacterium vicinigordonae]|uniref:Lycopene cyclase domain-containing protein n=1 Tax=Mycobacterium vicinigordonae TaxID=1719132 RepID=A0A7D6I9D3_9MYCO|nr:lycopene cyclase domain-containing protein [Mycobacterium vicinigordonae]QLL09036.1 lycopene cyclase domain-containing protein [Mycobacterium vicinigordonae]